MRDDEFEWDQAKARRNYTKHGVTFDFAHSTAGTFPRGGRRKMNKTTTSRKTTRAKPDLRSVRPMSAEDIEAAAKADPDAKPFSAAQLARMKHTPRAKLIRRALGLTQEQFAARFHIPLGTLRDWEQGAAEPDQAARAYLTVIGRNPRAVAEALKPTR
jgi:putative transcriptional regulator